MQFHQAIKFNKPSGMESNSLNSNKLFSFSLSVLKQLPFINDEGSPGAIQLLRLGVFVQHFLDFKLTELLLSPPK
jgi:hypothetical protein